MSKIPTWVYLAGGAALVWWLMSRNTAAAAPTGITISAADLSAPTTQSIMADLQAAGTAINLSF